MIESREVSVRYGDREILHAVSFVAPSGSITGFVGPNGAGKSTLMRVAMGLTDPGSGEVTFDGQRFRDAPRPAQAAGSLLSTDWFPPHESARSLLHYAASLHGLRRRAGRRAVEESLSIVGLAGHSTKPISSLSLGMRQRLGLAFALLGDPCNLILDEPVNGLDVDGVLWLRDLLRAEAAKGTAVLLSSHLMSELEQVADHVVVINGGRVARAGPLASLRAEADEATYVAGPELERLRSALMAAGCTVVPHRDGLLARGLSPTDIGRIAYSSGGGLCHLEPTRRSLEDVYQETMK